MKISIIGAGFAGVEAANFLADHGFTIDLYEMRDKKMTEAHKTGYFAEPVCSNSFKSTAIQNAHGLLKKEMEIAGSIVVNTAYETSVPAGGALAVDRLEFSKLITEKIKNNKSINIINEEICTLDRWVDSRDIVLIATGPLTSGSLSVELAKIAGSKSLYFFDAASPVVDAASINYDKVFFQSRYDKGGDDYLNAPFTQEEYYNFIEEIKKSEKADLKDFENKKLFEGCMPVEVLASRGNDTLAFGPMKPVGLIDPHTGKQPFAVLQLRTENINKSMFNLVGFQTRLKWHEQKRVFRMIPGLENAEFLRYGVMHKNTYLNFPEIVNISSYSVKNHNNIYIAGQVSGVEGYMESAASGLYTAYSIFAGLNNKDIYFPEYTMMGALQKYTKILSKDYQPMASNFGLLNRDVFNDKGRRLKKKDKKIKLSEEAIAVCKDFINKNF